MNELRLTLLGQSAIAKNSVPVTGFKSSKAAALLCYLAVTGQTVARTTLVSLLWSELGEANALMNLRHVLGNLRELVGDHLVVTRQSVAFQRESPYWLDVEQFERGLKSNNPTAIRTALDLYQGDFLAGLEMRQAPLFEEWRSVERTRLRTLAVDALQALADQAPDPAQAIADLRRLLALEPWRETAHRQIMERLAHSGQVNAALAHYERCRQLLADHLAIEPAPETTALYVRLRLATQTPASRLPVPTTPFVGRTTEIDLITRYLADPVCRCLTLVGPGGMGKTRLALAAAAGQLPYFLHGVVFVPLAAINSPEFMAPAIAAALHLSLHGQEEPTQQLLHYLQDRETLLLLDNLEQLLAGRALLAEILTHAPHVKIFATSRERLNLQAEWVIDIGGLAFPLDEATRLLQDFNAVQLFVETARRVQINFALTAANAGAIRRICQLVEGMPLGIELAAAWVRTLTCDEIANELAHNFDLLTTTQPDVPERHQSMRAVFAHSWGLLPAAQQTLLCQLAVFRGGFRQEAARQICHASLRDLAALIDKSLLQRDAQGGRFVLHELLRQFAAENQFTTVHNGRQPIEARHCHYYLMWLAAYTDALQGEEPNLAVAAILPEIDNIRQAWRWTVEHGEWVVLGRALPAWRSFYHLRGLYTEAGNWLLAALHHWPPSTDAQSASLELQSCQGSLLLCAAEIAIQQTHYAQALQQAETADKVATQYALSALKGQAQAMLGEIRRLQWAPDQALIHQQRAAPLLLQSGELRRYANLLLQMGKTYEQLHQWDRALDLQNEALHRFETLGDGWGCTISWGALGAVHYGLGHLEQALACIQQALARPGVAGPG
ncbi:MAG: BTAD domain-containing putative transcriptional regulator [Caldilineaceae bacterium]